MTPPQRKILGRPIYIAIGFLIIGAMLKIMHWQYGVEVLVAAFAAIGLLYIFRFLNKQPKLIVDYLKLLIVVSWAINGILIILHLPYRTVFPWITGIALMAWFPLEGLDYFKNNRVTRPKIKVKSRTKELVNPPSMWSIGILALAFVFTLNGIVFTLVELNYANELLIIGVVLGVIGLVVKFLFKK